MSLRYKLLLVALSTLTLPWVGWQFVRQTEALLRQGQEQALLASAGTLGKSLGALDALTLPSAPVLFVQSAHRAIVVDGFIDDWSELRPQAQSLGSASDPGKLRATVAENSAGLFLLAEVRDATRSRVDATDSRIAASDYLALTLERAAEHCEYRLASAAPGSFSAPAMASTTMRSCGALPEHIDGEWQEDGSGYRVELHFPAQALPERMTIGAHDSGAASSDGELRTLLRRSTSLARVLTQLAPENARARVVTSDGWVLASSGELRATSAAAGEESGWIGDVIYHGLIAPALTGSRSLDSPSPRINAAEVWQALSGVPATSWRSGRAQGEVVLAASIPLRVHNELRGALVLEQSSRALPVLANRALLGLAVASLIALAISGAILLLFGALLSFRIRRLRNAADSAVRHGGTFTGKMPLIDDNDELGDLARSFSKLFDEVGAYTSYLRTLASKLSHELNTPLAIVRTSLDNLDHESLRASTRSYLARARGGADRLATIVRAMSESSRIERAIASADAEDFDLRELIGGCAEGYRSVLAGSRELRVELPPAPIPFHGAPDLIAQALDKLFDNARSFSAEGGWIALVLYRDGENVIVRVANSGPLLPLTMQDRLFETLVSVRERPAASSGETPHLGLGLYVVRLVAEMHRGFASARNLPNGDGVEFALNLRGMARRGLVDADAR
ncbi:MAG: ATP-binding protein [Dokdonella sp.]